jgi:hypothetical protein
MENDNHHDLGLAYLLGRLLLTIEVSAQKLGNHDDLCIYFALDKRE